jgi:tricorn protease
MLLRKPAAAALSALAALSVLWTTGASAQDADPTRPLWIRGAQISPDGEQIAFSYRGQIWVVPANGGDAIPLTERIYRSISPIWSPDSTKIAFAADRYNKSDIFVVPADGGDIVCLTYHSMGEVPLAFTPDGSRVLFNGERIGDPKVDFMQGLATARGQVYSVPVAGGRERLVMPFPAPQADISPDGRFLAYTKDNGLEVPWRKGDISDQTRDIWIYDIETGMHRQLTTYRGNDRSPVWSADGADVIFASEMPESGDADPDAKPGTFNVWRMPASGDGEPVRLTSHDTLPVRFVSIADDGTIIYTYNTEIWRLGPNADAPERVDIRVRQGTLLTGEVFVNLNENTTEMTVSPDASEFAIVARGDVFVVSAKDGATRRITATPQTERSVSFSPDGRSLLYAAEREGDWDLYETSIVRDDDKTFSDAVELEEHVVLDSDSDSLQPKYSPQGDRIAYRDDRNAIRVLDIATGESIEILPDSATYSYQDSDHDHAWSPDGHYVVADTGFEIGNPEVELLDASAIEPRRNISDNGFADRSAQFSPDGAVLYWASDRYSQRNLDQQGGSYDIVAAYLTDEAWQERITGQSAATGAGGAEPISDASADTEASELISAKTPDLDGLRFRTARLTGFPVVPRFVDMTPDHSQLILVALQPGVGSVGYAIDTRTGAQKQLFVRPPALDAVYAADKERTAVFVLSPAGIDRYSLADGKKTTIPFHAEAAYDFNAEMRYIFDHQCRLVQSKFYDADMHGVDWPQMCDRYRRYLPHVSHWESFAELIAELQGELNASHMYTRFVSGESFWDKTATLGVFYDTTHNGAGVKIAEVMPGGPAAASGGALTPGAVILTVDGVEIAPDEDIYPLLNRKEGKNVVLTVQPADNGDIVEQVVQATPVQTEYQLAYDRWVEQRRDMVKRLSNGRLGYAHVAGMNDDEFRKVYGQLMGRDRDAKGAIIDVRFNTGGLLHDQLTAFLTGVRHSGLVTRNGVDLGTAPVTRWAKPTALLANAFSYSDGSVFPRFYKMEKLGPFVGDRVPGTGTAVLNLPQQEPRLSLAVAQLGFRTADGEFFENHEIVPDEIVRNDPNSLTEGSDPQLERAVELLLETLDN